MGTTEPIRDNRELKRFTTYYMDVKVNERNYCLVAAGLNTALRISDILKLKWKDVYDFNSKKWKTHIELLEKKTGKKQYICINKYFLTALKKLFDVHKNAQWNAYIFSPYNKGTEPLTRVQAYRIVKEAAKQSVCDDSHISCHSLRKTFGYHAYKQGASPALLTCVYNHSSFEITKRYLGIDQDEKDSLFLSIKY